ncbi:hypothetical protein Acr_03g0015170 [Actinidia rufa]|uniref:Uncharacterized protein n=1 Tax=Actinidia rufa TaxID=165716 RepID=A0A7J0EE57_9ERIC|nr:hypothetical protein Acr_03g0015170 [Actinidia rufa]
MISGYFYANVDAVFRHQIPTHPINEIGIGTQKSAILVVISEKKVRQHLKRRSLSDDRLTIPTGRDQLTTILYGHGRSEQDQPGAVNHALVKRSCFIHQTWEPVSLEVEDTEVRAYRTDPVQVRSCSFFLSLPYKNTFASL